MHGCTPVHTRAHTKSPAVQNRAHEVSPTGAARAHPLNTKNKIRSEHLHLRLRRFPLLRPPSLAHSGQVLGSWWGHMVRITAPPKEKLCNLTHQYFLTIAAFPPPAYQSCPKNMHSTAYSVLLKLGVVPYACCNTTTRAKGELNRYSFFPPRCGSVSAGNSTKSRKQ